MLLGDQRMPWGHCQSVSSYPVCVCVGGGGGVNHSDTLAGDLPINSTTQQVATVRMYVRQLCYLRMYVRQLCALALISS